MQTPSPSTIELFPCAVSMHALQKCNQKKPHVSLGCEMLLARVSHDRLRHATGRQ